MSKIIHLRLVSNGEIQSHGGFTIAYEALIHSTATGMCVAIGYSVAECSDKDRYTKRIGRTIALARLIQGKQYNIITPMPADLSKVYVAHDQSTGADYIDIDKSIFDIRAEVVKDFLSELGLPDSCLVVTEGKYALCYDVEEVSIAQRLTTALGHLLQIIPEIDRENVLELIDEVAELEQCELE